MVFGATPYRSLSSRVAPPPAASAPGHPTLPPDEAALAASAIDPSGWSAPLVETAELDGAWLLRFQGPEGAAGYRLEPRGQGRWASE